MYDPKYYENRRAELNQEYNALIVESYLDMERIVVKKNEKQQVLQKKLAELEKQEKDSKEKTKEKKA